MRLTRHALEIAEQKGFDLQKIKRTFETPVRVYESRSHTGQHRVTGNGLCLVGVPNDRNLDEKVFTVITIYEDEVLTAPRPDQMSTEEGRRFAYRYANGLGRG